MFTPTYIQLKYYFYPTGNTPAVNLLRGLPPSEDKDETVRALLLACGDPRNMLFSLWCEQGWNSQRSITFICCDIEPAILARNIVLFSLIPALETKVGSHNVSINDLWGLFYHLFVSRSQLGILQAHCKQLFEVSKSLEDWNASKYGSFINYLDQATLRQLRDYWAQYVEDVDTPKYRARDAQARKAIATYRNDMKGMNIGSGLRSAGPFLINAFETVGYNYRKYWETGVAGGNKEDIASLGNNGKGIINPMFAISGAANDLFAVHYGGEPLLGFHLVENFGTMPRGSNGVEQTSKGANLIHIDLFHGDALALSLALQLELGTERSKKRAVNIYTKPWSSCPLILDAMRTPNGVLFDVIDTSNLGDHVGLINILSAAAPLLKHNASSTLYTESLLVVSDDISTSLPTLLCSDITTFSLMIGLAPAGLLTGAETEAVSNEALMQIVVGNEKGSMKQYRMRIPWKYSELGDQNVIKAIRSSPGCHLGISFDPKELADALFGVYRKMFAHEDISTLTSRTMSMFSGVQRSTDRARYTRAGMVALLCLVSTRTSTDWDKTMNALIDQIETDRSLLVGTNSLQELYMHLHIAGVWTSPPLSDEPRKAQAIQAVQLRPRSAEKGVLAEAEVLSIVHIALVVPRDHLRVFTDRDPDNVGTPALHISIEQTLGPDRYENCFFSFQPFFGKISTDKEVVNITEDIRGWLGSGNLIVICPVPAFGLLMGPRDGIRVSLRINSTPENISRFGQALGLQMKVFEASLKDERRLMTLHNAPLLNSTNFFSNEKQAQGVGLANSANPIQALVRMDGKHRATHLKKHVDFPKDSPGAKALIEKEVVTLAQSSQYTVTVNVGPSIREHVHFPFPVQGVSAKLRIARKSSWIEIEAPIFSGLDGNQVSIWTTTILDQDWARNCWNIPRVNLAIQPTIRFSKRADFTWIRTFIGTAFSDTERLAYNNDSAGGNSNNAKVDFKSSLNALFQSFVGLNEKNPNCIKTFQLASGRKDSVHTLIFATAIRHDLDLGSLVMEAYVVPLTDNRVRELGPALARLQHTQPLVIRVSDNESILWKYVLPAFAERCRDWNHKPSCEYLTKGAPLSTEHSQTPLCSCGEGKVPVSELSNVVKEWRPFVRYATRIAIAPIFPVPYLEKSMSKFERLKKEVTGKIDTATTPKPSSTPRLSTIQAKCDNCGTISDQLKACAGCGKVKYCGKECQKAAWKGHKIWCTKG